MNAALAGLEPPAVGAGRQEGPAPVGGAIRPGLQACGDVKAVRAQRRHLAGHPVGRHHRLGAVGLDAAAERRPGIGIGPGPQHAVQFRPVAKIGGLQRQAGGGDVGAQGNLAGTGAKHVVEAQQRLRGRTCGVGISKKLRRGGVDRGRVRPPQVRVHRTRIPPAPCWKLTVADADDVSSFKMVPVALAAVMVAPVEGLERLRVKVSFGSIVVSPATFTVTVLLVSPAAKLTVPVGKVAPAKWIAAAGLVPLPATVQLALVSPLVSPERVTVKANAV